jgi:hypothetical protein
MRILLSVAIGSILLACYPGIASAAIADSSAYGFTVRFEQKVKCHPDSLYTYLVRDVGKWWSPGHTWSGNAANLSIRPVPGGCFCEKLDNGGFVRHLETVYADPGKSLRLEGGLGPLQMLAVTGSMSFVIKPEGDSAKITLTYAVGGYFPGGTGRWPALVDKVLGEQFGRLINYAEGKK